MNYPTVKIVRLHSSPVPAIGTVDAAYGPFTAVFKMIERVEVIVSKRGYALAGVSNYGGTGRALISSLALATASGTIATAIVLHLISIVSVHGFLLIDDSI